jgi:hypothetical protein
LRLQLLQINRMRIDIGLVSFRHACKEMEAMANSGPDREGRIQWNSAGQKRPRYFFDPMNSGILNSVIKVSSSRRQSKCQMASAAGAPAAVAPPRPAALRPDEAVAIRDTVDGGAIPNLSYQTVEQMTHMWTTKQLGSGGFGEVFKGMMRCHSTLQCNNFLFMISLMSRCIVDEQQVPFTTHSLRGLCTWPSRV